MKEISKNKRYILENVLYRMLDKERSICDISEIPHKDYLDLSMGYHILSPESEGSYIVTWRTCEELGITEGELDGAAWRNTREHGFIRKTIQNMLLELTAEELDCEVPGQMDVASQMWVFTNKERMYGATAMVYPEVFRELAMEIQKDLFILPASMHEVIAIPASDGKEDNFRAIVQEINIEMVEEEDVISDSIYRYRLVTGEIAIA